MGQASLAVFYVVFGVLTIYLNLETIVTWDANGIYRTVSSAVREYPFPLLDVNKTKHLDEVEDPQQVYSWMAHSLKPILFREQTTAPTHTPWEPWNYSMTPATIGAFNRVLLVRFTFKRWAKEETSGAFEQSTPYRLAGGAVLSANRLNLENRTQLCADGKCIQWQTAHSFDKAGGYTEFFDPMEGPDAYDALLKKMSQVGLFDMLMATCTVDMVLYNPNVDMFLQYIHTFTFDFSGHIYQSSQARGFNLNVFNCSVAKYLVLYIIQCICLAMVVTFGIIEVRRCWTCGFLTAFQKQGAVTDIISITVSFGVLISYFIIERMRPFQHFQFEALQNMDTRADTYVSLCDAARTLQIQGLFIALNLFVVSLRTVSLVSGLHSNLGLIVKVIRVAWPNFAVFIVLFGMLLTGFVLTSFFAFGPGYSEMSNIWLCIYKSFSMLTGGVIYYEMSRVDKILGPIYFFSFYLLFYLVLINIFITLLMTGYDIVDYELQRRDPSESEKNPLVLIFEELKADVLGTVLRYGDSAIKCCRFCWDPIVVSVKAACSPFSFLTNWCCRRKQILRSSTPESQNLPPAVVDEAGGNCRRLVEIVTAVLFMATWICLAVLHARGLDSYLTTQATLISVRDVVFYKDNDMKVFDQIHTFSDVKTWAETAIVGLYDSPVCAESTTNGASIWTNSAGCDSSSDSQQLLNRIADWNIGFLNTTFVRVTIQPACFVAADAKWASGSPLQRKTPDVECWNSVCTQVLSTEPCRTADGNILDAASLESINSALPKMLSSGYESRNQLGPFRMLGGFAFGFGVTKKQCQDMLALLDDKGWFTKNSASIVFDWLTYNGNVDFFTHNVVAFSLLETGILSKSVESLTLPMNVDAGGGYFRFQSLILALFAIYALLLLYHTVEMGMRMIRCFWRVRHMNHRLRAFFQDFCGEPWNLVELVSILISLATYVSFLVFVLEPFRSEYKFSLGNKGEYVVPNNDVKYYHMPQATNRERYLEDDWYIFKEFEQLQLFNVILMQLASLNSLWTGFKTIKTITKNFKAVGVFGRTLANVRVVYFLIVIMLQMLGFAFAMTVVFGTAVEGFSYPSAALQVLTYWVCGPSNLYPLMSAWPGLAVIFFVAFTIVFRFISANMFLATQLNTFAALCGEEDIQKARREAAAKMGMKRVIYHSQRELQRELKLELNTDLTVEVKTVLKLGKAVQANVKAGDVIYTVNHLKVNWQAVLAMEEYEHVERALMPGQDGSITIMFQNPPRKRNFARLKTLFCSKRYCCSRGKVKPSVRMSQEAYAKPPALRPTVNNFWRFHGAIAEVEKDLPVRVIFFPQTMWPHEGVKVKDGKREKDGKGFLD